MHTSIVYLLYVPWAHGPCAANASTQERKEGTRDGVLVVLQENCRPVRELVMSENGGHA